MERIYVHGGIPLQGQVQIQGSKNAALPILAATLLTESPNLILNCPKITDVFHMMTLLKSMGCVVKSKENGLYIEAQNRKNRPLPKEESISMRSSITLLGALLSSFREVVMEYPGGCVIGQRPIDLHLKALTQMGASFESHKERFYAHTKGLHGAKIVLPFPSVGATENIILAAVKAEGKTEIHNAAKEPEIVALCQYLNACGGKIIGQGLETIFIEGVDRLHGVEYRIPADRIVAGTYLFGCLCAGGSVFLKDIKPKELKRVLEFTETMGAQFDLVDSGIYIKAPQMLFSDCKLSTDVYPGFPTDLQSFVVVAMSIAKGVGRVEERVFENRFHIVEPLQNMGAKIKKIDDKNLEIQGVPFLEGCDVKARELRGGAALVIAGLCAKGQTKIEGCQYIERGYENICKDLRELGARIYSV